MASVIFGVHVFAFACQNVLFLKLPPGGLLPRFVWSLLVSGGSCLVEPWRPIPLTHAQVVR